MNRSGSKVCLSLILCLLAQLPACEHRWEKPEEGTQLASATAPGGASRAFVWQLEMDGLGATVSQPYQVWMQSLHGEPHNKMIFEADKTEGVRLAWKGPRELEICYGAAQINRFLNYYYVSPVGNSGEMDKVEIRLRRADKLANC
jgi:hypothetical protein